MNSVITTDSLSKRFGSGDKAVHALNNVSITVGAGEVYALLGPNGAGKTTFIKCLLGIIYPSTGNGTLLGSKLGSIESKRKIGYLPENHRYPLHLTGEQVLSYFGKLSGLNGNQLATTINQRLEQVGMSDWRDTKVRKYSKGMMQRLGLAQALLNNPDLLILDEPTDGVDPVGRKEIREILHSLKQEGKSVFLNSHLLSEVERVSDRVAIMKNGTIVTEGSLDYLTSTHNIYQLKVEEQYYSAVPNILHSSIVQFQDSIYDLSFASNVDMNKAIDLLRKEGIIIESIIPKRTSLEDVFISLIKDSTVHRV